MLLLAQLGCLVCFVLILRVEKPLSSVLEFKYNMAEYQ